jgi:hypothetical protein
MGVYHCSCCRASSAELAVVVWQVALKSVALAGEPGGLWLRVSADVAHQRNLLAYYRFKSEHY